MLDSLNPQQKSCVKQINGPVVLLAGAGTGKTRVITFRISYMLQNGIKPQEIIAVTFTNKAAREMRHRVTELVGPRARELNVGTFHSFCIKLLRKYHQAAGLDPHFGIAGMGDQLDLVRKALEERGWEGQFRVDQLLAAISFAKNQLWDSEQIKSKFHAAPFDIDPAIAAGVFELYQRQLKLNRYIDFDDCIYHTVRMVRNNPQLRQQFGFNYMLVDEFQDTNYAQLMLIHELCRDHHNVCVVGDDDQSIYSWRGAMPSVINQFEELFPAAVLIKLEQNYRCTNMILDAANHVIKNNSQRKEKNLWSDSNSSTKISLIVKKDDLEEARLIASKCMGYLGKGHHLRDIGILYRANIQSRNLELALREFKLRYKVFGGQSFFERKEVKDLLAYLRLIAHPHDRLAFWRIINMPNRGLGMKTLEQIEELALKHKCSPFAVLEKHHQELPGRIHTVVLGFVEGIKTLRQTSMKSRHDLEQVVSQIIQRYRLEAEIQKKSSSAQAASTKIDNLRKVPMWIGELADGYLKEHGTLDLKDLMENITLGDQDHKAEEKLGDYISLMTIHAAKGLEFPIVFLCGVEEGLLPHRNSLEHNDHVAEERRLFYVALTRAKEKLHLTYALERGSDFRRVGTEPSRFLAEIPDTVIEREFSTPTEALKPEEKKSRTLSRLSQIRSSLSQ